MGVIKPNAILNEFRRLGEKEPPKVQLKNYLSTLRSQKFGEKVLYLNELEIYANEMSFETAQSDIDAPFVTAFDIDYSRKTFYIALSTKRLLQTAAKVSHIQIDATYKLNYMGYPLIIAGVTDKNRVIF